MMFEHNIPFVVGKANMKALIYMWTQNSCTK